MLKGQCLNRILYRQGVDKAARSLDPAFANSKVAEHSAELESLQKQHSLHNYGWVSNV